MNYKIAYNQRYYVVNYGSDIYGEQPNKHYTAVYTKKGKQISITESPSHGVLKVAGNNQIYALPHIFKQTDSILTPAIIMMDVVHQKVLNEKQIGTRYTMPNSISFTGSRLVVTGTNHSPDFPDKTPATIFYYSDGFEK